MNRVMWNVSCNLLQLRMPRLAVLYTSNVYTYSSYWFTRLIMYVYYIIHTVYFSNRSPMQIFYYQFWGSCESVILHTSVFGPSWPTFLLRQRQQVHHCSHWLLHNVAKLELVLLQQKKQFMWQMTFSFAMGILTSLYRTKWGKEFCN